MELIERAAIGIPTQSSSSTQHASASARSCSNDQSLAQIEAFEDGRFPKI
jgi:hypothetical protein